MYFDDKRLVAGVAGALVLAAGGGFMAARWTGIAFPGLPEPDDAPRTLPSSGQLADGGVFFEIQVGRDGQGHYGLVGPTAPFGALLLSALPGN